MIAVACVSPRPTVQCQIKKLESSPLEARSHYDQKQAVEHRFNRAHDREMNALMSAIGTKRAPR
jgi:hypothetical protein